MSANGITEKVIGVTFALVFVAALVPYAIETITNVTLTGPAAVFWGMLSFVVIGGIVMLFGREMGLFGGGR